MNNQFARIFLAIQERIEQTVSEIKHIDHDLGQLEGYSNRPEVAFPCILTDFDQWQFENLGANSQQAQGDVIIKLAFAQVADSSNLTQLVWRNKALEYYDIEWKLHKALQGWSPAGDIGYLTRTSVTTENRPMGVRIRTLRYRLEFEDFDTKPVQATAPVPDPNIQ